MAQHVESVYRGTQRQPPADLADPATSCQLPEDFAELVTLRSMATTVRSARTIVGESSQNYLHRRLWFFQHD